MKISILGIRGALGFTSPELVVSVGVGSLVLMVMAMVFTNSARSFSTMGNYLSMDRDSRNALDQMTREIRGAGDLIEFTSTHLKFARFGTTNSFLSYDWDPDSRQLTQWSTDSNRTNILLSECDQLAFSMHKPSFASTSTISEGKAIAVNWKCSRMILGNKLTTEDMEQALIVIRNKPL